MSGPNWPVGQPDGPWLTAFEATMLVCPDAVWLSMLPRSPLRSRRQSPKCYRVAGVPVHVQPDCRCPR